MAQRNKKVNQQLKTAEPEEYEIGWKPFLDTEVFLDSRPLIPRNETEHWVEKAIAEIPSEKPLKCLDLFAGSGAIGIAVLKHRPLTHVDFGEINPAHFPTIGKSLLKNGIAESRTRFIETDVWSNITDTYDYIFANPPYLSKNRLERIQPSVLAHEPHTALFAEEDGFALIRKTIEDARKHLSEGGVLWIEHEPEHVEAILTLSKEKGFRAQTYQDQYKVSRFSSLSSVA